MENHIPPQKPHVPSDMHMHADVTVTHHIEMPEETRVLLRDLHEDRASLGVFCGLGLLLLAVAVGLLGVAVLKYLFTRSTTEKHP